MDGIGIVFLVFFTTAFDLLNSLCHRLLARVGVLPLLNVLQYSRRTFLYGPTLTIDAISPEM
jgi:hypothetical protein